MKSLTQKQADVFLFIRSYIKDNDGMSPTKSEIAIHFKVYPTAIGDRIKGLIKKGAITYDRSKMRSIKPVKGYRLRIN
jgi:SOS-response transcriptional repressor LexA